MDIVVGKAASPARSTPMTLKDGSSYWPANKALIGQNMSFDNCKNWNDHDVDGDVFRFSQRPFQHLCLFSNPSVSIACLDFLHP